MSSRKPFIPLKPELRLIGSLLNAAWAPGARRQWPPALFEDIDWRAFEAFVWQHKLRPMAARALQEAGWPGASATIRKSLERDAEICVRKALAQLQAQSDLAQAANSAGIRFIALKGIGLSTFLYGDPLIRESFDFDLLVASDDTERMKRLLQGIGFEPAHPKPPLTRRQNAILARYFHEEKFINLATGAVMDVHHALSANPWRITATFEDLWKRRRSLAVGKNHLAIPGDSDLLWYLSAHAASHAWERWKWAGDMLALCRKFGSDGLTAHRSAAKAGGWSDLLDSSLLITSAVTGWEMPPEVSGAVAANRAAAALARRALRSSARPLTPADALSGAYAFRLAMFRLRLRKNPRYLAHELAVWLHRPLDWYELQLADPLIPAYYLLRPVLFLKRGILLLTAASPEKP